MRSFTATVLGFDPGVLGRLERPASDGLQVHVVTTCIGCATAGWSSYAASRTLGGATWTSAVSCLGAALFVWNLFRLHNAGSGLALHTTEEESAVWRPRIGLPVAVFLLLSAILAQAAHVSVREAELRPIVERHRRLLALSHERALLGRELSDVEAARRELTELRTRNQASERRARDLAEDSRAMELAGVRSEHRALVSAAVRSRARLAAASARLAELERRVEVTRRTEVAPYIEHLARTPFPALCVVSLWDTPLVATLFTVVFMIVMTSPLLTRALAPSSIRAYEILRRQAERSLVVAEYERARADSRRLLEQEVEKLPPATQAGFAWPRTRFADAPFNRVPLHSLYEAAQATTPEELLATIEGGE